MGLKYTRLITRTMQYVIPTKTAAWRRDEDCIESMFKFAPEKPLQEKGGAEQRKSEVDMWNVSGYTKRSYPWWTVKYR
jgi:hypothetical protein